MSDEKNLTKILNTLWVNKKLAWKIELLSRKQRRKTANLIICLIESCIDALIQDEFINTWDTEEDNRLLKLKKHFPYLLTYKEECKLKELSDDD